MYKQADNSILIIIIIYINNNNIFSLYGRFLHSKYTNMLVFYLEIFCFDFVQISYVVQIFSRQFPAPPNLNIYENMYRFDFVNTYNVAQPGWQ